jgi:hypothetical protein
MVKRYSLTLAICDRHKPIRGVLAQALALTVALQDCPSRQLRKDILKLE